MSSLKDLQNELRAMRKDKVKPVSKMKKNDIALEIERMRDGREATPLVASVGSISPSKKVAPATATIKKAKEQGFPVRPASEKASKKMPPAASKKKAEAPATKKKTKMSKAMLRQMMEGMSSSDEE